MELRYLELHGQRIAFHQSGHGPLLLLIHGMAGSAATWQHVVPSLAERFTVLAPDLIGHGASAKPRSDYSIGAYATHLRDLLAALGYERATLIGQSFGGGVAMQMAYQYPEVCERLVLIGSGGLGIEVHPLLRWLSLPGAELALHGCRPSLARLGRALAERAERRGWRPHPALVEVARSYASLTEPAARQSFFLTLRSVIDRFGQRVSARHLLYLNAALPTLIMWGTSDPVIPVEHAHDTHAAMPGSRLELFEGVLHYPHCEDPSRFVRVLVDFLDSTRPREAAHEVEA